MSSAQADFVADRVLTIEPLAGVPVGTYCLVITGNQLFVPVDQTTLRGGQVAANAAPLSKPVIRCGTVVVHTEGIRELGAKLEIAGFTVDGVDFDLNTSLSVLEPLLWPLVAVCTSLFTAESFRYGETPVTQRARTVYCERYPGLFHPGSGTAALDALVVRGLSELFNAVQNRRNGDTSVSFFLEHTMRRAVEFSKEMDALLEQRSAETGACVQLVQFQVAAHQMAYTTLESGPISKNTAELVKYALRQSFSAHATAASAAKGQPRNSHAGKMHKRADGLSHRGGRGRGPIGRNGPNKTGARGPKPTGADSE